MLSRREMPGDQAESPGYPWRYRHMPAFASISGVIAAGSVTAASLKTFFETANLPISQQHSMNNGRTMYRATGRNHIHTITSANPVILIPPFGVCALGASLISICSPSPQKKAATMFAFNQGGAHRADSNGRPPVAASCAGLDEQCRRAGPGPADRLGQPLPVRRDGPPEQPACQHRQRLAEAAARHMREDLLAGSYISIALLGVSLLLGITVSILIVRQLTSQLGAEPGEVAHLAESIARGDFSFKPKKDAKGVYAAMFTMSEALKNSFAQVTAKQEEALRETELARQATQEATRAKTEAESAQREGMHKAAQSLEGVVQSLNQAFAEMAVLVEQCNSGSREQAAHIGKATGVIHNVRDSVLHVADIAAASLETAGTTRNKAEEGASVVEKVVGDILDVQNQALRLKDDMGNMGKHAEGIGEVLNVISDIADQTNLLALNAAIEAARAGEAGRGFAVVADEVRKLAEKTMTATKEVGDAITTLQAGTRRNIQSFDTTVATIQKAADMANASGEALRSILEMTNETSRRVGDIAGASRDQSAEAEHMGTLFAEIQNFAETTGDSMSRASDTMVRVSAQAENLKELIAQLKR